MSIRFGLKTGCDTRQVPIVQPLRVIETPTDGVNEQAVAPSDNPDGTVLLH
jgi:hypothetical protein